MGGLFGDLTKGTKAAPKKTGTSKSGNNWQDFKDFASWAYSKATSHPIDQLTDTLKTGKPPRKKAAKKTPSKY